MINLTRGERFRDARTVYNAHGSQTMAEVYSATGISASKIADLENDDKDRGVDYREVGKLAKHYGVSVDWLLGLSDVTLPDADLRGVCEYTGLSEGAIETLRWIKENDPYNDMKVLSSFLENKGRSFVGQLSLLINLIYRSKPELDEFKNYSSDNWRDLYNLCYELKLGAFSFSEYCRSIADDYGLYGLIAEAERKMTEDFHNFTLSYFDLKCKENDNGEHTEN